EASTWSARPPTTTGSSSTFSTRRTTGTTAWRSATSGSRMANSSPPRRATVSPPRSTLCRREPMRWSSRSPLWWPSVSFTSLNRSRSMSITAAIFLRRPALEIVRETRLWKSVRFGRAELDGQEHVEHLAGGPGVAQLPARGDPGNDVAVQRGTGLAAARLQLADQAVVVRVDDAAVAVAQDGAVDLRAPLHLCDRV